MKARKQNFTLLEVMVSVALFSMISIALMDLFEGSKRNIVDMLNRESVSMVAMTSLSNIQESIHQAAEIYNHVPVSTTDDTEANLFYKRIDWSNIPDRMGTDLGNPDYHNRLADIKGQTQAISDWKAANIGDAYADRFHDNDLLMSLHPNGPGVPENTRGYTGNVLLIARHLKPIEVVLSPTDADFDASVLNPDSHFYKEKRQKGHQIHVYTGGDGMPGDERMYAIDVVRFELYYLTEDTKGSWTRVTSITDNTLYRDHSLRLVKAESAIYLVHSKFENMKTNFQKAYDEDQTREADDVTNTYVATTPNDFTNVFDALNSSSSGVYFDTVTSRYNRELLYQTVEYIDSSAGLVLRDLDLGGANGFSSTPVTDNIDFPSTGYITFINNNNTGGNANISVAYNTVWTSGAKLKMVDSKHVPWFAQQPDKMNVSTVSELFPGGFEISGSGFGDKQRMGIRLCLWLRKQTQFASYGHFMIGGRAQ